MSSNLVKRTVTLQALTLGFALLLAKPSFAVDDATRSVVRQLSIDGVAAYQAEDYGLALEKLEKAWSILPTAPLGLWSGRALEKSGRLVEASERYVAATRAPLDPEGDKQTQESARGEAQDAYRAVQARIPKVTVILEGADSGSVTVTVAGKELLADVVGLPVPVDPGTVEIKGVSASEEKTESVTIAEGEQKEVRLVFTMAAPAAEPEAEPAEPAPAPGEAKKSWQPLAGWIGIGVGGAGIVLGAVTGGIAAGKYSELGCGDGLCNISNAEAAGLNGLRTTSTVGFIVGGVLAAAGVTLLLTAPKKEHGAHVRPYFAFDSAGIAGTF